MPWAARVATIVLQLIALYSGLVTLAVTSRGENLGPAPVCFTLAVGFLAVLSIQGHAAARTIEAIERSRPTPDELADALRAAAKRARGPADPPPVPGERG